MAKAEKLPSGKWRCKVFLGRENGKVKTVSITAKTKKEAERKALLYEVRRDNLTFYDASERYLAAKSNTLSPNTLRSYRILQKRFESIYDVPLNELTNEKMQILVNEWASRLSPKGVKCTYGFFTAVSNMFDGEKLDVTLPSRVRSKTPIPTKEELKLLIDNASPKMSIAIRLAAFGSLRSGEICALRPGDVFKDHISITKTLALDEFGNYVIKNSPKTYAGFRDVPLPIELLRELKDFMDEDGLNLNPNKVNSAFRRLTNKLDLYPYRFHSLRHFFASFCHAKGIPDQYIMKIGGWDDISTLTKIYQDTMPDEMKNTVKIINDYYDLVTTELPQEK